jgi:3-oxoacyl-[acyl-carrier-protein] synthase-3
MGFFGSKITGTGSAFPSKILTNLEIRQSLAKLDIETSDEWIVERTGIRERRISTQGVPSETNSSLSCLAAVKALEMAGKKPQDIDAIFLATVSPDRLVPSASCILQKKLGATRAFAMDLNAGCSGFVYGVTVAHQFIQTGSVKTALVVGTDILSSLVDWKDRSTCILFGDAAGAAIIEQTAPDSKSRILSSHLGAEGEYWDLFDVSAGGSEKLVSAESIEKSENKIKMKGKEIFKIAVRTLSEYAVIALEKNNLKVSDVDWFIPHQANLRIIEAVAKRLDVPMSKVLVNLDRYGNTSSGTVPTAMDEAVRDGRIKKGQLLLMDVFGAGLTYGSVLLRW